MHLQVQLEGGRRRLQHHVVVRDLQMFPAADIQLQRPPIPQSQHLFIERTVAFLIRHVGLGEFTLFQGRQDTDHHQVGMQIRRTPLTLLPGRPQAGLKTTECRAPQVLRMVVQFNIKSCQLWHHHGVVQVLQEDLINGDRARLAINQPGLQFVTTHAVTGRKHTGGKPLAQQCRLLTQMLCILHKIIGSKLCRFNFLTHCWLAHTIVG